MRLTGIRWVLIAACSLLSLPTLQAQTAADSVIVQMADAARRKNSSSLSQLLPAARGHILEPWAAYWELKSRLENASSTEIEQFLQRYKDSYQEDRLRNDWLLLLGQVRDWPTFARVFTHYRMQDDPEVRCYATVAQSLPPAYVSQVLQSWQTIANTSDACSLAAQAYADKGLITPAALWPLARVMAERGRTKAMEQVVEIAAPGFGSQVFRMNTNPLLFLRSQSDSQGPNSEIAAMALIRIAASNTNNAVNWLESHEANFSPTTRSAVWAVVGKQALLNHDSRAWTYMSKSQNMGLSDDLLAWKARSAMRAGQWAQMDAILAAMSEDSKNQSQWLYWRGRALAAQGQNAAALSWFKRAFQARASTLQVASGEDDNALPSRSAGLEDFYVQLAYEQAGLSIPLPPKPEPPTRAEMAYVQQNAGLQRALAAIRLNLRSEGVREWNYETNLHQAGGMPDRLRLAAAHWAEENAIWDRSINTSERTREFFSLAQRYPTPLKPLVLRNSEAWQLDPALVYGLIRQESRFVSFARSGVGASGLMQVMKATARNVARRLGLSGYSDSQIHDADTNLQLGTGYLRLVLDDFENSNPMALAAYNAGPGRPRKWRETATVDADVWVETIPFGETRDYVKKVLSNAVMYRAVLNDKPGSLKALLGKPIGPRSPDAGASDSSLP